MSTCVFPHYAQTGLVNDDQELVEGMVVNLHRQSIWIRMKKFFSILGMKSHRGGWGLIKHVNPKFQSQFWKCDFIHVYKNTSSALFFCFLCLANRFAQPFQKPLCCHGEGHYLLWWTVDIHMIQEVALEIFLLVFIASFISSPRFRNAQSL